MSNTSSESQVVSDTLSASIVFLLAAQVLQRSVGLGRNILFCGMLSDAELGRWSLAFNFLMLAAPLVVLGLPGSFGRYVERYRQRGQLRSFLTRTGLITLVSTVLAVCAILAYPSKVAEFAFGDPQQVHMLRWLALALFAVVGFNFLVELFTAMRLVRYASLLQLVSSLGFAVAGGVILVATPLRETGVAIAYGTASLLAMTVGVVLIARCWTTLPTSDTVLPHSELWRRLLPFASWIWLANLIGNLFEYADQFMLKHFSNLPAAEADALIGQYYTSRVIPVLLVAIATVIGNSLLPHLSHDWEAGRRSQAMTRLQLAVKLVSFFLTLGAAAMLLCSSLLFSWALGGRYDAGLSVLPGTLVYCAWFGLTSVALYYLLCAEAAHLGSLALFLGLAGNVALNYLLAPRFGLPGVVTATVAANGITLLCVIWFSRLRGMRWDRGSWIAVLPLTILMGGMPAAAIALTLLAAAWQAGWIFNEAERVELLACGTYLGDKLKRFTNSNEMEEARC